MGIPMNQHKEQIKVKYVLKIELEELRHKHIMEELKFMAKNNIKLFERYGSG